MHAEWPKVNKYKKKRTEVYDNTDKPAQVECEINDSLNKHQKKNKGDVLKEQAVQGVVKCNVKSEILTYILLESCH